MNYKNLKVFGYEGKGYEDEGEYVGMWVRDAREGYGMMSWGDQSKFEGYWKGDKRVRGTMTMIDGQIYEGNFLNDKFHGKGKLVFKTTTSKGRGQ